MMREGIDDNLQFLILEVEKQLDKTRAYCAQPSAAVLDDVVARDDYIDNLKLAIQRKCFQVAAEATEAKNGTVAHLKAVDVISVNLERIADFCVNVIRQIDHMAPDKALPEGAFEPFFEQVRGGLSRVGQAVQSHDAHEAIHICRSEQALDDLYAGLFHSTVGELESGDNVQSLVTRIFIAHYFERMGDSLLNIGEAILSDSLGETIRFSQLNALNESLERAQIQSSMADLAVQSAGETRSGCRVNRITSEAEPGNDRLVIFKEGQRRKLEGERAGTERWNALMPGLVPQIYSSRFYDDKGAILYEYVRGDIFERLILNSTDRRLDAALDCLIGTLVEVWNRTRQNEPIASDFTGQLRKRLDDVYTVHPEFRVGSVALGDLELESFERLIDRAQEMERDLTAPFSVLIHGDFNVDNVIYDDRQKEVRFIDLHRSRMGDYAQDISTFLVSNHRLQVFDPVVRRRINGIINAFYDFVVRYAETAGDASFSARLALGVARSFATSARFVLDKAVAREMFMRSRYLLESLVRADREHLDRFVLPRGVLID